MLIKHLSRILDAFLTSKTVNKIEIEFQPFGAKIKPKKISIELHDSNHIDVKNEGLHPRFIRWLMVQQHVPLAQQSFTYFGHTQKGKVGKVFDARIAD